MNHESSPPKSDQFKDRRAYATALLAWALIQPSLQSAEPLDDFASPAQKAQGIRVTADEILDRWDDEWLKNTERTIAAVREQFTSAADASPIIRSALDDALADFRNDQATSQPGLIDRALFAKVAGAVARDLPAVIAAHKAGDPGDPKYPSPALAAFLGLFGAHFHPSISPVPHLAKLAIQLGMEAPDDSLAT